MYSINFANLLLYLLPPVKRSLTWLSDFIASMFDVLSKVNEDFLGQIAKHENTLRITGQVIQLEKYLNDVYDNTLRRIYISDGDRLTRLYLYNNIEQQPRFYLFNKSESADRVYLYQKSEFSDGFDFVVNIPSSILSGVDNDIIKAQIDVYKQAGKRYSLVSF